MLLDLHEEPALRVGLRRAGHAAVDALQCDGVGAAGEPHAVCHLRHRAHRHVLAFRPGNEQHALLVTHVHRQGHVHVGEDDDVLQGYEQQSQHAAVSIFGVVMFL